MEDNQIIALYFARSEDALKETQKKYDNYLYSISYQILKNHEDAEECVNDTYQKIWESIPPERPERLRAFAGKIIHNISLNKYKYNNAAKRYNGICEPLDELEEMISMGHDTDILMNEKLLTEKINSFLTHSSKKNRIIFVRRYWYFDSVKDISARMKMSESSIKVSLKRTRDSLKKFLVKEGFLYE